MRGKLGSKIHDFFSDEARTGGSGQALVEFCIAFPFQLFLTFGLLQLMLLMISSLMINFAVYKCARSVAVDEDPLKTAQIILAPIAHSAISNSANINVPGWGSLSSSGAAYDKVSVTVTPNAQTGNTVVQLTFRQQLIFPFVDALFRMVSPSAESNSSGSTEVLNGKTHMLITRTHVISKASDLDVGVGSPVYDYTWDG